jgi:hypothetical protein
MRSVHTLASTHAQRARISPPCGDRASAVTLGGGSCSGASFTPPPLCLPSLHGHYPASSLLRRLCHLPGTVLRASGHELRSFPQLVIPDSRRSNFLPFCLLPPHAFLPPRSLSHRRVGRQSRLALHGSASGSRLRLSLAGSPMHQAESSSTWFCLRTGSSLPVAPHPVSRRRSYLPLSDSQCSVRRGLPSLLSVHALRRTSGASVKRLAVTLAGGRALHRSAPTRWSLQICLTREVIAARESNQGPGR